MRTLPPGQSPPPVPELHLLRHRAESFGADAELYDRTRDRYPQALVQRIIAESPGPEVLDVGCGTGIAARQFRAAGCTVLGVEPDARMARFARGSGIEVEVATFEAWDPSGRTFDAVIAGTAWQWVDPVAGAAKAAQVLRPGGRLTPFNHVIQVPPELAGAVAEAFHLVEPVWTFDLSVPALDAFGQVLASIAAGIRIAGQFSEPEQWQFDWERTCSRDQLLDLLRTHGWFTQLPPGKLAQVLAGVSPAIDAIGGSATLTCATVAITAARTGAP